MTSTIGDVDVLVANHAYMTMAPVDEHDLDDWWRIVDTNLGGTFLLVQAALPGMRRIGCGRIVVISSEWGVIGWPDASAYSASKAGLISLTKTLGRELAPEGIVVNAIAPGVIDTPQLQVDADAEGVSLEQMQAVYAKSIPLGRIGGPSEIAATVAFLADPAVGSLVGQVVQVNGASTRSRLVHRPPVSRRPHNQEEHVQPHEVINGVVGQIDSLAVPRYAGFTTFARLPRIDDVESYDIAVLGVPFDTGVTYRPGARFGPSHIRQSSRLLRPYNPEQSTSQPFRTVPGSRRRRRAPALHSTSSRRSAGSMPTATDLISSGQRLVSLGGDHTIALPLLRAMHRAHGPIALVHFDAHLDTWDTYFGAPYTHGTPFRRAWEEGLLVAGQLRTRGDPRTAVLTAGSRRRCGNGLHDHPVPRLRGHGLEAIAERVLRRVGDAPVYLSVDIDVLDPAFAPGTGTPEGGGMTSRELLGVLRTFSSVNLVGADVVEVAPAYDHAEITGVAAANVAYEFISVMAKT